KPSRMIAPHAIATYNPRPVGVDVGCTLCAAGAGATTTIGEARAVETRNLDSFSGSVSPLLMFSVPSVASVRVIGMAAIAALTCPLLERPVFKVPPSRHMLDKY